MHRQPLDVYEKERVSPSGYPPVYEKEWDGHGNEEKYARLARAALEKTDD